MNEDRHEFDGEDRLRHVEIIVDALRKKFGSFAIAIADAQAASSEPGSRDVWREVSRRLKE